MLYWNAQLAKKSSGAFPNLLYESSAGIFSVNVTSKLNKHKISDICVSFFFFLFFNKIAILTLSWQSDLAEHSII
jgi:hypothetical protein